MPLTETELKEKTITEKPDPADPESMPDPVGGFGIYCDLRFKTQADRDEMYALIKELGNKIRYSKVTKYLCNHDEGTKTVGGCVVEESVEWDKDSKMKLKSKAK